MLVKFIARGTGSAQAAADYLTRELDSQGAVRDDVAAQHETQAAALQAQLQQLDTQVGHLTTQYVHITADYKALAKVLSGR